jgi:putative phosphoribosyl transferase
VRENETAAPRSFRDRADAGRRLASLLERYAGRDDVVVLALPRGGIPVALEIARALAAPLEAFVVRKLGVPGHEELAFGALATGGARVLNAEVVDHLGLGPALIESVTERERRELERRERLYRDVRPPRPLAGKTVVLVDDGLATGASMRAAVAAARAQKPARIVVAVPVAAAATCDLLRSEVDELVCPLTPESFYAVSLWYERFEQLTDAEVRELLASAEELGE